MSWIIFLPHASYVFFKLIKLPGRSNFEKGLLSYWKLLQFWCRSLSSSKNAALYLKDSCFPFHETTCAYGMSYLSWASWKGNRLAIDFPVRDPQKPICISYHVFLHLLFSPHSQLSGCLRQQTPWTWTLTNCDKVGSWMSYLTKTATEETSPLPEMK